MFASVTAISARGAVNLADDNLSVPCGTSATSRCRLVDCNECSLRLCHISSRLVKMSSRYGENVTLSCIGICLIVVLTELIISFQET